MARLVKNLANNKQIIFDEGRFDNWCVYLVESFGIKTAPFDVTCFSELKEIAKHYSDSKVYHDFVSIYTLTTKEIDPVVLKLIDEIVLTFQEVHQPTIEKWFTVIYAGMIAEENKQHAVLKKRIKRLGMHQVLILGMPPFEAAKFSYGKKWTDLDAIMKPYGF
ncbi:MAG: DUF7004 family protein [Ginsengibacter sp.]